MAVAVALEAWGALVVLEALVARARCVARHVNCRSVNILAAAAGVRRRIVWGLGAEPHTLRGSAMPRKPAAHVTRQNRVLVLLLARQGRAPSHNMNRGKK